MLNNEVTDCKELNFDTYFKKVSRELQLTKRISTINYLLYELKYRKYYILSRNKPYESDDMVKELNMIEEIIFRLESIQGRHR